MALPHARRQTGFPGLVGLAEPGVAEAVRMLGAVLLPEQRPRHAAAPQLPLHLGPVRHRSAGGRLGRRRPRKQPPLQLDVGQLLRQRPGQPRRPSPAQVGPDRPLADAQRRHHGALAQPGLVLQSQHVADPAHRQSLGWHPADLVRNEVAFARSDCRQTSPGHPLLRCPRSRAIAARLAVETLPAIPWKQCPRSRGIRNDLPVARSNERRSVLPSTATTPRRLSAKRCMKRVKQVSNAFGSSRRNTRLKVSWLGAPCRRHRNWRRYGALISPNSAMSEQSSPPDSKVQSAIINNSCRSWRALSRRGSTTSAKQATNSSTGRPQRWIARPDFSHAPYHRNTHPQAPTSAPAPYAIALPNPQDNLDTGDSRFVNASTQVGDSLWNVHTIALGSFAAPKFYQVRPSTASVLQSGFFFASGTSFDFNPSIAANTSNDVFVTWNAT